MNVAIDYHGSSVIGKQNSSQDYSPAPNCPSSPNTIGDQDDDPESMEIKRKAKSTMANKLRLKTKGLTIDFVEPRMVETDSIA